MELNDNKAGMSGLDKEKINSVIRSASEGSLFYQHELKRKARLSKQITSLKLRLKSLTKQQISAAESETDHYAKTLEEQRDLSKVIMHLDMDAFYAAVEMRDDRKLRHVPMAVGSYSMLSTSNYAARKFGVRAAMPGFIGKKLCPDLIIVPCNFRKYHQVSDQITEILSDYDPDLCKMSLDEAYMDLTNFMALRSSVGSDVVLPRVRYTGACSCRLPYCYLPQCVIHQDAVVEVEHCDGCNQNRVKITDSVKFGNSIEDVASEIRFRILQATGLTASAGVAPNTMLAKICSDLNKPNGQYVLESSRPTVMNFIREMKIRKVPGIGAVTESMLRELNIVYCKDLFEKRGILSLLFSPCSAEHFLRVSLGISGVMSVKRSAEYERKSMSVERTFKEASDPDVLKSICKRLCVQLSEDAKGEEVKGRCVSIKLKTIGFDVKTRASSSQRYINDAEAIFTVAHRLLQTEIDSTPDKLLKLRLMGVRLSMLCSEENRCSKSQERIDSFIVRSKDEVAEDLDLTSGNESELELNESGDHADHELISTSDFNPTTTAAAISLTSENQMVSDVVRNELQCPVCYMWLPNMTLVSFNQHIDVCLNRHTIGELLREEEDATASATSSRANTGPGVKRRRKGQLKIKPKNKTILSYLKRDDEKQTRVDDT